MGIWSVKRTAGRYICYGRVSSRLYDGMTGKALPPPLRRWNVYHLPASGDGYRARSSAAAEMRDHCGATKESRFGSSSSPRCRRKRQMWRRLGVVENKRAGVGHGGGKGDVNVGRVPLKVSRDRMTCSTVKHVASASGIVRNERAHLVNEGYKGSNVSFSIAGERREAVKERRRYRRDAHGNAIGSERISFYTR